MTAPTWILHASGLNKQYGPGCHRCQQFTGPAHNNSQCPVCNTVYACVDAGFTLHQGEVLGIVGESGSGKSTLLQMVNPPPAPIAEIFGTANHAHPTPTPSICSKWTPIAVDTSATIASVSSTNAPN